MFKVANSFPLLLERQFQRNCTVSFVISKNNCRPVFPAQAGIHKKKQQILKPVAFLNNFILFFLVCYTLHIFWVVFVLK